jgi:septal ring factor EnvC (AmiA/AmiB activator)
MGDATMTQAMSDLPADPSQVEPPPPPAMASAPAPDTDVLRVVHELESRMAKLETKLEESNEARDRLERQVAAQSEELRVQRAAIARTQRALRTMSRGDEDKATEPALRDGDTQAKTRVVE